MADVARKECENCNAVSQKECQEYREAFQQCVGAHETRLDQKDIRDAKNEGIAQVQTKLLWGIFGVGAASFFMNLFGAYMIK